MSAPGSKLSTTPLRRQSHSAASGMGVAHADGSGVDGTLEARSARRFSTVLLGRSASDSLYSAAALVGAADSSTRPRL